MPAFKTGLLLPVEDRAHTIAHHAYIATWNSSHTAHCSTQLAYMVAHTTTQHAPPVFIALHPHNEAARMGLVRGRGTGPANMVVWND